jgi:hypothetical protein
VDQSDLHFLFGYQAFLKKDFSGCVNEFEASLKTATKKRLVSKSSLFKAICRAKLDQKKLASYEAVRVRTKYLSSWDKRHFTRLKNYLNEDFNVALREKNAPKKPLHPLQFSMSTYGGQIHYPRPAQKKRVGFAGLLGSLSHRHWDFVFGYERNTLRGRSTYQGFSQTQGHLALGYNWQKLSLTGRFTNIASDSEAQDAIRVYGVDLKYQLFSRTKIFADGYYSNYPNSPLSNLTVFQASIGLEQKVFQLPALENWIKAGVQQTRPSSSKIDNGESFITEGSAVRSYLELYFRSGRFTFMGGFWGGREAFGVRNNGVMIFSTPEEHLGGQTASLHWDASRRIALTATFMNENIRIDKTDSTARTTLGTFTYHFY